MKETVHTRTKILILIALGLILAAVALAGRFLAHPETSRGGALSFSALEERNPGAAGQKPKVAAIEWKAPGSFDTKKKLDDYFSSAKASGFTDIYIRIDDALDFKSIRDRNEERKKDEFDASLRDFVSEASEYGIRVEGLGGAPEWILPKNLDDVEYLIDYVAAYNAAADSDQKLGGMVFDIEPQALDDFDSDSGQQELLSDFVEMIDESARHIRSAAPDLTLGFTVPFWFDGATRDIPNVPYAGSSAPTVFQAIRALSQTAHGEILVMAYRNKSSGHNGAIELSSDEINFANNYAPNVRILVGIAANKTSPSSITFYGKKQRDVQSDAENIVSALGASPSFGGLFIHDFESYEDLKK